MSESLASSRATAAWRRIDLQGIAPFAALAVLFVLGYFVNDRFVGLENITNVLARSAFIATIAVGATFVITAGGLDLSVGSMAALVSGVMILFLNSAYLNIGVPLIVAAGLLALLLGALLGAANGIGVTAGRIEPFIVTLGTLSIYRSVVSWLANGGSISITSPALKDLYSPVYTAKILGVPIPVLVILAVALIGSFLLHRTRFGRHVTAVGSNEDVARYSGISVGRVRAMTYIIQGVCVAIAVIVYVPRLGSTNSATGLGWELQAITAVVVGGTALRGGTGRVWGTICGAVILEVIGNIMTLSNRVDPLLIGAVQGAIIIIAMLVQRTFARKN